MDALYLFKIESYIIDVRGDEYITVGPSSPNSQIGIWRRTAGSSSFVRINQLLKNWFGMASTPEGRIYACAYNGDIYKK